MSADISWLPAVIGGMGVGSVVSILVAHWIDQNVKRQQYIRDKKEEAYVGLLSAYSEASKNSDDENRIMFLHWHLRIQIFGSKEVDWEIRKIYNTKGSEQIKLREKIIELMRRDLGLKD